MTYDQLAVRLLLDGNEKGLTQLARHAAREIAYLCGDKCPNCGATTGILGNDHGEFHCCECDHQWGVDSGERYGF